MNLIVFDSSTIINLTMNNFLPLIKDLKKSFSGKFIVPHSVKHETVKRPLTIKKFKLNALNVSKLFDEKIFEGPEAVGIKDQEVQKRKKRILDFSNKLFYAENQPIHIIDDGEAECLAVCMILNEKKVNNILAVDERTTRVLGENPDNLKKILGNKLHKHVTKKDVEEMTELGKIKFIRSSEIVYVAYKKGLIKDKNFLDAMLYSTKFKGAAISDEEIKQIEAMA